MTALSRLITMASLAALSACATRAPAPPAGVEVGLPLPQTVTPLRWADVQDRPAPARGIVEPYGPAAEQFGVVRLPDPDHFGPGPYPVVALIHGGCWLAAYDHGYFAHWAEWLTQQGFATWNLEYRRLGQDGGGWPGTLADAADGVDHLRALAARYPLDLQRVAAAGHSAGGHLALWLATRDRLVPDHVLYRASPLPLERVIGLAAIVDLAAYREGPPNSCHSSVDALLGGTPTTVPERYAAASPAQRLPLAAPLVLLHGRDDPIVDPASVQHFVPQVTDRGGRAELLILPGAGHFDLGAPTPASREALRRALRGL